MSYEFVEGNHRAAKTDALYCLIQDSGFRIMEYSYEKKYF